MDKSTKEILSKVANTVRVLSAEAIEKPNSGHPGLPLGCADIGAYLYSHVLRHNPKSPGWLGRDRFVLSAGHGSMFLYSLLHLSGYGLPMKEIQSFRTLHSMTPGHPEYGEAPGVETTTGPLGQGVGAAVGMAIAQKMLGARFSPELFGGKVYTLAGDGCMMEGIASEACSLAGHLGLDNLVVIYDSNSICLDGETAECFVEDTAKRFFAYGFNIITMDGHDFDDIERAFAEAGKSTGFPTLIVAKTTIGKGAPTKQGTNECHGAALGAEELKAMKKNLGWPEEAFHVPAEVTNYFAGLQATFDKNEKEWNDKLAAWKKANPEKAKLFDCFVNQSLPEGWEADLWDFEIPANQATRKIGSQVLNKVSELVPWFITGSADLSVSDLSNIKKTTNVTRDDFSGRNLKFGVREFAMGTACYGIRLSGMLQPLCGTFMTFSDYMRNSIRVAAIMKQRVIYQFTHDSVFLGEDGPTHQPVEHYAALRAIPNLSFVRPCDENEAKAAWIKILKTNNGPVALGLSRQNIPSQGELTRKGALEGVARGAYILYGTKGDGDVLLCATGSEVAPAMDAAKILEGQGKKVRVVSMPCWEYFEEQSDEYKASVLGGNFKIRAAVEAGIDQGWHKYIGVFGWFIGVGNRYGVSADHKAVRKEFGLDGETIAKNLLGGL